MTPLPSAVASKPELSFKSIKDANESSGSSFVDIVCVGSVTGGGGTAAAPLTRLGCVGDGDGGAKIRGDAIRGGT